MDETAWLADIRPLVPGATDTTIKQTLRLTINEFYTQSASNVVDYPPISLVQGQSLYSVPDTVDGKVLYLLGATYNDEDLRILASGTPKVDIATPGYCWFKVNPNEVQLSSKSPEAVVGGLKLNVVMAPLTVEGSPLPDIAGTIHYQHILDGTLGRMYKQPAKPWTDTGMSGYHLKRFRIGMAQARELQRRGYSNAELAWTYPRWA